MKFVSEVSRTHYCGRVDESLVEKNIVVMGWVDSRRDHGGLVFVDLRDREGIVQVVLNPNESLMDQASEVRNEFVLAIQGRVQRRPLGMENPKLKTGQVEIIASCFEILSVAQTLPIPIGDETTGENLRLKYRYLDLRSQRLQAHLRLRHEVHRHVREFLSHHEFLEIETPILYKSTPEGARDYLVASRIHHGHFYALPQSPQTLKQLLMISGFDRYFQIARCFRDEDLRADRQPEFSQIDIEMSFVNVDDVLRVNEELLRSLWRHFRGVEIPEIPRMSYYEAMNRFGVDRPDTRFGMELTDLTEAAGGLGFRVFDDVRTRGGVVKGIVVANAHLMPRAQIDKLTDMAKAAGAAGLIWIKFESDEKIQSPISKILNAESLKKILRVAKAQMGDLLLIVADSFDTTCATLSTLRLHLAKELKLIERQGRQSRAQGESQAQAQGESKGEADQFVWVVDFPLFEFDSQNKRWAARHHPFTSPTLETEEILLKGDFENLAKVHAYAYDLVCNGHEIAGGSLRNYRNHVQQAMFRALGLSDNEVKEKFGFFIEALSYGTPPHGGIAWGMDRLLMILCGTDAIREVIAFPKTAKASCLMSEAPSPVQRDQLIELGLSIRS